MVPSPVTATGQVDDKEDSGRGGRAPLRRQQRGLLRVHGLYQLGAGTVVKVGGKWKQN